MVELKPCPFCGGKAEIKPWIDGDCFCIGCLNDECHGEILPGCGFGYEDKEIAIKTWNTRTEPRQQMEIKPDKPTQCRAQIPATHNRR